MTNDKVCGDPLTTAPPKLPQHDKENIVERQNMIERRRLLFNYTRNATIAGFPKTISMPPSFLLLPPSYAVPLDQGMYGYAFRLLERKLCGELNGTLRTKFTKNIETLEDYAEATGLLNPKPKLVQQNSKHLWDWLSDAEYARQRLQGMNPEMIEQVRPDKWEKRFSPEGVTPFNLESVLGEINAIIKSKGGEDFKKEMAAGNIYMCDYSLFTIPDLALLATKAFNRYIAAPLVIFFRDPMARSLYPLAIQLFPGIKNDNPVFVSDGSYDWLYAKIWANSVDGQYQEIVAHLWETHLVAEVFEISLNRRMGTNHPIYQLLHPHFFATLFINQEARGNLLAQDGAIQTVIGAGVPGAAVLIDQYKKGWHFMEHSFPNSLLRRGFDNFKKVGGNSGFGTSPLSGYFWEDDGLKLWKIISAFVRKVLDLFYKTPEDIANDFELQEWVAEIESPTGGDLKGVSEARGKIVTIEFLTDLLTHLIFTVTAKHSMGNIGQFELYGFIPNVPGALYLPPPKARGTVDRTTILNALPPQKETLNQIAITYLLSDTGVSHRNLLNGTYPGLDKNDEARAYISEFHKNLKELSKDIGERNGNLTYPYISLDPAKVANSINV